MPDGERDALRYLTEQLPGMERTATEYGAPEGKRLCAAIRTLLDTAAEVERLVGELSVAHFVQRYGTPFDPTGAKTGSEILALRAEVERLREERDALKVLGARILEQWSERDGVVELDGFSLAHTDDADLGVWTTDDAANGRTATEMFFGDDPFREALEWFAARSSTPPER